MVSYFNFFLSTHHFDQPISSTHDIGASCHHCRQWTSNLLPRGPSLSSRQKNQNLIVIFTKNYNIYGKLWDIRSTH